MATVVVVGSGAVGTLAAAIACQRGHDVTILDVSPTFKDALVSRSAKSQHQGFERGWRTGPGGTTTLWGGQVWCWDEDEFRLQASGIDAWPHEIADLRDHYRAVFKILGLPRPHEQFHLSGAYSQRTIGEGFALKNSTWMSRCERNFQRNRALRLHKRTAQSIRDCSEIVIDEDTNTVRATKQGETFRVSFDFLLIAAGTIGNFCHVKSLRPMDAEVGKGFIDHVSSRAIELEITDWNRFRSTFCDFRFRGVRVSKRHVFRPIAGPNPVLPAYAHIETPSAGKQFIRAGSERQRPVPLRSLAELGRAAVSDQFGGRYPLPRDSRAFVRIDVQQPTRRSSYLSGDFHAGVELNWHVGQREVEAFEKVRRELVKSLSPSTHGCIPCELLEPDFTDTYHLMGGTRMGSTPNSLVDPDCRLAGANAIFVLGASTFPSGGLANPTITALALTHRVVSNMDLH